MRLTRRFGWTIGAAVLLGIATTWLGILLAYDSYYWGSSQRGLPVSFCIVTIDLLVYLGSGVPALRGRSARGRSEQ